MTLADYCRQANMGYRDDIQAGIEDIELRIHELERLNRMAGRVIDRFMSNPEIVSLAKAMD